MISWIDILTFTICGAMLVMMAFGIILSASMPALDRWNKLFFIIYFSLLFLCACVIFIDSIFWANPKMGALERIVWFSEFLFMSILTFLPTIFLLHRCDEIAKKSNLFRAVMALWGIYLVLLIISQFTEIFYYVTPENMCERGPLFALLLVPLLAIMLFNIGGVLRRKEKLSKSAYIALLVDLLPMAIAIFLHMFIFASVFIVFGMTISAMTMFVLIFRNNMAEYMRQQREIASQRAGVMVLQMRPHFIYNTMMGIYYLCDLDSQKAKQVTLDFTTYLRKNFTAIASEDTIPFHDELEHTRAYLAVEQAQYDDSLHVNFDTPHTLFRIPPLTLQPIVENAVKHGMKSSIDPIRILVVTRKTETASELIVEDNGPGFDPNVDDNDEPHIALNNIRHRLELMCKGTLEISPREGGGTSVKVTIPAAER